MALFPYWAYDTPEAPKLFILVQLFVVLLYVSISLYRWRENRARVGPYRDGFNKLITMPSLIHLYFLVEFAFTISNISLNFSDYGFVIAIGFHSLVEYLIAIRMLFDYRTSVRICYYFFVIFVLFFFFCFCLPWPLYLVIFSFVVLPGDILTFVVSLVVIARVYKQLEVVKVSGNAVGQDVNVATNVTDPDHDVKNISHSQVRILGIIWCFHMVSAFLVFGIFLLQFDVGFLFSVNTFHQCFYLYCLMPFAVIEEDELEKYGFLASKGAVTNTFRGHGADADSLESGDHGGHVKSSQTTKEDGKLSMCGKFFNLVLFVTDRPMKAFNVVMGITCLYATVVFSIGFGLGRIVISDIYTNDAGYYWPGGQLPN